MKFPKLTEEEAGYINAVVNPFGNIHNAGKGVYGGARVPDSTCPETIPLTLHASATYTCAAAAHKMQGCIKIREPDTASNVAGLIASNDLGAGAGQVTDTIYWKNWTMIYGSIRKYRVVGMALKVMCTSANDTTAGYFKGGIMEQTPRDSVGYNNFVDCTNEMIEGYYTMREGITVRWFPRDNADLEFSSPPSADSWDNTQWRAPVVYFDGSVENTKIMVQIVLHIEATVPQVTTPFQVTPSPISLRFPLLYAIVSLEEFAPYVTKGHSFWGFMKHAWQWTRKIATFLVKAAPVVYKIASAVAV